MTGASDGSHLGGRIVIIMRLGSVTYRSTTSDRFIHPPTSLRLLLCYIWSMISTTTSIPSPAETWHPLLLPTFPQQLRICAVLSPQTGNVSLSAARPEEVIFREVSRLVRSKPLAVCRVPEALQYLTTPEHIVNDIIEVSVICATAVGRGAETGKGHQ